jgi:pimeloyl-ACP methyl ester carboxylesterase
MKICLSILLLLFACNIKAQCDTSLRPVVFVHGFLASGDTWANAVHYFQQAGYCANRMYAFDWNSVGGNGKRNDSLLHQFIEQILTQTGASQIDLVGHSAGGGLGRNYLKDSLHAKNIAHYVHIGSRKWTSSYTWFPNSKCMNIFSSGDRVAGNTAGAVEGAINLALVEQDHYQVATSDTSIKEMLQFFSGKQIPSKSSPESRKVVLSGRAVILGENLAMGDAEINIYAIQKKNGQRKKADQPIRLKTDQAGAWGPVTLSAGIPYEMELIPAGANKRIISYFFPRFDFSNPLVYLRGFPEDGRMTFLLGKIPAVETQSTLVVYSAAQAMVGGRDSVTVNGLPICSPTLTPASKTAITSFLFDDGDAINSGKALKQFSNVPFIGGVDMVLPANAKKGIRMYYNGQQLTLPARPSKERILLAVFR